MEKQLKDFGKFVSDKILDTYVEDSSVTCTEDDIADMFVEFTKLQQKQKLKLEDYVKSWIDEWAQLFPKGIRSGGKPVRSNPKDCLPKMIAFVKEYKYERDLIFFATKKYLAERSLSNYDYTRCAVYFIGKKGEGSDLAAWCDQCSDSDLTEEKVLLPISEFTDFI